MRSKPWLLPLQLNLFVLPLCAALLALSAPAWADIGRDEAAMVAQQASSGRVLSVDRSEAGGRVVWRVKVLTARGEVRVILVDAATGRML
jgi:hypothetical protein